MSDPASRPRVAAHRELKLARKARKAGLPVATNLTSNHGGADALVRRKEEEFRIKNERHDMKKQTHYWDVLKKDAETCFRIGQKLSQNRKLAAEDPGFEAQYTAELAKRGTAA